MACATSVLVSSTSEIRWTPCGTPASMTSVTFDMTANTSAVVAGSFRISINGVYTAAITYSTVIATLVASIQAALDATWAGVPQYTAAITETTKFKITADQVGFNVMKAIIADEQGQETLNATFKPRYTVVGTETFAITPQLMSYSVSENAGFEDVTPLSQKETVQVVVSEDMSFDISMYDAGQTWGYAIFAGAEGVLGIWKEGRVPGSEFVVFNALLESSDLDGPNKGKLERSITGQRQGAYIFAPGSIYL